MKKVLITGKNSYIGRSFKAYVEAHYPSEIQVDSISVRGDTWREYDFSQYDAVLHVAALVHKNEKNVPMDSYLKVNRDLTVAVAEKAKLSGVKHFIFVSTIAVYGNINYISKETQLIPVTKYGISKLEAEKLLYQLESSQFSMTVVRPPMIYGYKCPGNYERLSILANKLKIYPKFSNKRSMIFIDNLSVFFYKVILEQIPGIFLPQNKDYVDTANLIQTIKKVHGKSTIFVPGFSYMLKFLIKRVSLIGKVYGSLIIDFNLSGFFISYNKIGFRESVKKSEKARLV